ncbi:AAA family ATPase [Clostridium sp. MD294]|uniref:ParA family protein n=1 Tax=Clostridium sp. MD294 TaxID=97138 RepID=UPI0002C8B28F|nr:AAA family ATPase [Clostridium sp. MD294]NDO47832.1 ParA family protein [Clostridium sp. MD294]USF29847.1 Sporulation initiation inhibitor protein Soj [Clostridium sp. MD294]
MAKIIAVCNQKGGVGKTVTTVNLGIGLAQSEKKVLLVDMDAQASLTLSLGYQPEQIEMTIANIMGQYMSDNDIKSNVSKSILHHKEKVDLLPSNIELSGLEAALVNTMSRETVLRNSLKVLRDKYDYIIVDCSPSLGMLTINSLAFADTVLIPVQAQYLSIKGLEQLIKTISRVKIHINRKLDISGILITMANMRTNYSKELVTLLHQNYDGKLHIFKEYIPMSIKAAEISAEGTSIYIHDKNGKVAKAYESLVQEVLTWQK